MKKFKLLFTMCLCASLVFANVMSVSAAGIEKVDTEMTREELREFYSIDELAEKYEMNADELTEAFYQGVHSDYFSPFSMVESLEDTEGEDMLVATIHILDAVRCIKQGMPILIVPYIGRMYMAAQIPQRIDKWHIIMESKQLPFPGNLKRGIL